MSIIRPTGRTGKWNLEFRSFVAARMGSDPEIHKHRDVASNVGWLAGHGRTPTMRRAVSGWHTAHERTTLPGLPKRRQCTDLVLSESMTMGAMARIAKASGGDHEVRNLGKLLGH